VYLLRFSSQGLLSSVRFYWQTPGSFLALLHFLDAPVQPRWLRVLQSVGPSLSPYWTLDWPDAFLGAGGMGKVFRVRRTAAAVAAAGTMAAIHGASAGALPSVATSASASSSASSAATPACASLLFDVAALKIVDDAHGGLHITALQREAEQVQALQSRVDLSTDACSVLPQLLHPFTLSREPGNVATSAATIGAAALFGPVGESLTDAARNKSLWLEVCEALLTLHLSAIVHGDPRVPNLIRVPIDAPRLGAATTRAGSTVQLTSRLVWIDFCAAGQAGFAADCRICLESFFNSHDRQFVSDRSIRIGHHADTYQSLVVSLQQNQEAAAGHVIAMSAWRQTVWQDNVVNLMVDK
jgi:hypothetical protein